MSEGDQDVAIRVVNPSPSSRLSPSLLCPNVPQHTQQVSETVCVSEHSLPAGNDLHDNQNTVKTQTDNETLDIREDRLKELGDTEHSSFTSDSCDDSSCPKRISNDDIVQNSTSKDEPLDYSSSEETRSAKMGNQSGKKKKESDEDTPDETKTKCCEIPKKKLKDRNSKVSKSSRSDENDFDEDEVYPFDMRTRTSEHDDNDTVELEPFEIVETDDIKFIPGAGTSEVIRNASESKFKAIPEEPSLDEEDELRRFEEDEETILKEIDVPNRGDKILESGTSTAHSTFEFRQVKTKGKLKSLREESQTVYENVDVVSAGELNKTPKPDLSSQKSHSSGSSRSNSSSSSKDSSRKNSKEPIQKPARNGKKKKDVDNKPVSYENTELQENKLEKIETAKLQETPKTTNAVILTQTMFSKPKTSMAKSEVRKASLDSQNTYENVNLCAILTPTGIIIGHKTADTANVAGNLINVDKPQGEQAFAHSDKPVIAKPNGASKKKEKSLSPQAEYAIYETIKSVSQEDKPNHENTKTSSASDNNDSPPRQSNKYVIQSQGASVGGKVLNTNDKNVLQVEAKDEAVPPPSPQGMEILEEEDEEDDDDLDDDDLDISRKNSEINDFTEIVCKRLSQLLESMSNDDENSEEVQDNNDTEKQCIHIYEEVLDKFEHDTDRKEMFIETETPEMISSVTRLDPPDTLHRNDSNSTLKRISGDSNTYPMTEFKGSSDDDDLPQYFDPRNIGKDEEFKTSTTKYDHVSTSSETSQRDDYVDMTVTGWKASQNSQLSRPPLNLQSLNLSQPTGRVTDLQDITPTAEATQELTALPEYANVAEETSLQYHSYGRQSVTYTESDLDISEHRDDLSTDSMLADDEDDETMEILFTKTYTEPEEGGEVFLSCTVVNSAYKQDRKTSDTWLSDDALQYFEANAAEVMSTAFMKAKKEMKDIQMCIQNLRHQMEHFHGDCDDVSLPEVSMSSLSPDYFPRKAVTD